MKNAILLLAAVFTVIGITRDTQAGHGQAFQRASMDRAAQWHGANSSWHGPYMHPQWGHPVALIVPPTARYQTEYSWGVGRTMMRPIHYQFGRPVATPGTAGGLRHTPPWPWSTEQLGVYSVRGPW